LGEEIESGEAGHFDIEKQDAGTGGGKLLEGIDALDGFRDFLDDRVAGEEVAESPASGLLVVDDQGVPLRFPCGRLSWSRNRPWLMAAPGLA
jgi:hypothetical protein